MGSSDSLVLGRAAADAQRAVDVEAEVGRASSSLAVDSVSGDYFRQGEFVVLPAFLGQRFVQDLRADFIAARSSLVRRRLPGYKRSESVGGVALRERALTIDALYRSPALLSVLRRLTDAPLRTAPDWDPHACAVYHYDRPGDGIGFHYDTSFYRGARYTVLVGLTNDSSSRLVCDLLRREPQRAPRRVEVSTDPGTLVLFHGDKVWHSVSPIGADEERTVLTLQYVTDPRMSLLGRIITLAKDALAYFGFREVVRTLVAARSRSRRAVEQGGAP